MPSKKGAASRGRTPGTSATEPAHRKKRPTINDVARLAQVSKKTVSRVINDSPFVHTQTRENIKVIIGELGFVPDPQARGLAFRRSFLIGMLCDDPLPPDTIELQQGVLNALRGTSFELVIRACSRQNPKFQQDVRDFIEGQRLFGVVLPPPLSANAGLIGLLRELACPAVRITAGERGPTIDLGFAAATELIATKR